MTKGMKILESGLEFLVSENELFRIESYVRSARLGIKTVEFVWLANKECEMRFIEAKSSAPRKSDNEEKRQNLKKYIEEISEKWLSSVQIMACNSLSRLRLPDCPFEPRNWESLTIKLYLVLGNEFKREWCPSLQDAFNADENLKKWRKIWSPKYPEWIKVLNKDSAQKLGLLSNGAK